MMKKPFILGVNYWPRRKAMYWWSDFDEVEVQEDFSLIHDLGMKMIRIFLLWEDFQPAPDKISSASLDHLVKVCDIAANLDLKLNITFFTGNMSGPNWSPSWLLDGAPIPGARQLISSGEVIERGYLNPFVNTMVTGISVLIHR